MFPSKPETLPKEEMYVQKVWMEMPFFRISVLIFPELPTNNKYCLFTSQPPIALCSVARPANLPEEVFSFSLVRSKSTQ